MNKYKELIKLVEDNNFTFQTKECYDAQSGWTGKSYYIFDGDRCLTDLSGNGYCFSDGSVDIAISKIKKYLTRNKIETFDDFKKYLDDNAAEAKEYVSFPELDY